MGTNEDNLTIELLLGSLNIAPEVEKACTWMLIGTGAAVTLIISNIDDISQIIQKESISLVLLSLSLSALFGFASKLHALRAQTVKVMFQCIFAAMNQHKDTNVMQALESYTSSFPVWIRWRVRRGAKKGFKDPLYGFKVAHKIVVYQNFYASIQGTLMVLAVFIATIKIW